MTVPARYRLSTVRYRPGVQHGTVLLTGMYVVIVIMVLENIKLLHKLAVDLKHMTEISWHIIEHLKHT